MTQPKPRPSFESNTMTSRIRNSPPIKEIILEFLSDKTDPTNFNDIYNHVSRRVTLVSKKPRASVFSVLTRMVDVERIGPGKYMLIKNRDQIK